MARSLRSIALAAVVVACFASSVAYAEKYCLRQSGDAYTVESRECTALSTDLVEATYLKLYEDLGWDQLVVSPIRMDAIGRTQSLRLSGYLEGYLTYDRMWSSYYNAIAPLPITPAVYDWIEKHRAYMASPPASDVAQNATFWAMVGDLLAQMDGLRQGYNAAQTNASRQLNDTQIFWMSFQAEFGDLFIFTVPGYENTGLLGSAQGQTGHCSGFIRDTHDDLFMAHDTWSEYNTMLRQFKVYNFGTTVAMSSYPGVIHSIDDWYMTSNRLTVQETTNILYNNSVYKGCKPETVSEFLRVMAANYLSQTGADWMRFIEMKNSGTYNNQWMVVDQKLFVPNEADPMKRIPDGTLHVYEQLPDPFARWADVSHVLRDTGRWISYNLPYFKEVYDVSGNLYMEQHYGSYYNYSEYARPKIFEREYHSVKDLSGMKRVMRYNDYKNDNFSLIPNCINATNGVCNPRHSAMLSIASRGDLDPVCTTKTMGILCDQGWVGMQAMGAIDSKITSHNMTKNISALHAHFICGPTQSPGVGNLPPFAWNASWVKGHARFDAVHKDGLATVYDFPWIRVEVSSPQIRVPTNDNQGTAIAIVVVLSVLLVGIFAVLAIRLHVFKIGAPNLEESPLNA